jgi:hypothetical protein
LGQFPSFCCFNLIRPNDIASLLAGGGFIVSGRSIIGQAARRRDEWRCRCRRSRIAKEHLVSRNAVAFWAMRAGNCDF